MAVRGKGGVEKPRLLAARMRKEGKSIRQIARTLCKPYSTVHDWLVRMHRRGSKGRFDKKRRGGKRLLSNGCLKRLRRLLYEDPQEHGFEPKSVLVRPIRPDPVTAITRNQRVAGPPAWNQDTTE